MRQRQKGREKATDEGHETQRATARTNETGSGSAVTAAKVSFGFSRNNKGSNNKKYEPLFQGVNKKGKRRQSKGYWTCCCCCCCYACCMLLLLSLLQLLATNQLKSAADRFGWLINRLTQVARQPPDQGDRERGARREAGWSEIRQAH